MGTSQRQLKVMLRKNWLIKIRHPCVTCAEILLPTIVMLMLIAVRTQVDTRIHPAQPYIRKEMFVEVGKGDISPTFNQVLESLLAEGEHLAFAPDTNETSTMINILSIKFPLLKLVSRIYKDELEFETYIRSDLYGVCNEVKNCPNPKIKGAIIFHDQGPELFDYSIRLNHTWAFSGFPDVKTIMDIDGPYLNDLELGVDTISIMQYGFSGFLTLQQVMDSFIIYASQKTATVLDTEDTGSSSWDSFGTPSLLEIPWTQFSPSNIRLAPFPTREYTDDEFQSIIKKVMGVLYLLGFLYPVSRLISYSVFEKEQKIKEGLYMMGLKDGIFYLSWFITYALQFAISSVIITLCTIGTLFEYSDKSVVFVYFFVFGLSAIMLSFLISTFFTRAKTAVAVGTLSFLGAFYPYYTVNDQSSSMILKVIASLLSPTAFALGTVNFADYERAHVGLRWSNIWQPSSGVNFLVCLLMMFLDTLLYCAIGLYLDKVLPNESGVRHPGNFIFQKCFRRKKSSIKYSACSSDVSIGKASFSEPVVEAISLEMKQQQLDGRCIQMRNLRKVYTTKKGTCCAVKSLQLTLYENQILALLGHNGAGKSTTISMLVGLLSPTSGDALVLGKNILTDMDEIRKGLGVCPQNDILFSELTVKEHLEIFASLKGVKEDSLESVVNEMIDDVGLADKVNTVVRALSGGMKRKLSLGIALIGDSKVIVLDEPMSRIDPYSMRLTWQLIKKIKKGRIILLTTHSMDEADVLGDRIAIMANGSLKCCGSSLFLKREYGVGYTLTLVKTAPSASVAADIVYRHIPSATCVSEVGTEISFKLPLASSSSFESMFREIEGCMTRTGPNLETEGSEHNHSLGIESYGISVTTLEEVFLRVAGCDYNETECIDETKTLALHDSVVSPACHNYAPKNVVLPKLCGSYKVIGVVFATIGSACSLFFDAVLSFLRFLSVQCCCCCCCFLVRSTFWQHCKALFIKRAISARRDRKTIVFQLLIPAIFLLFGLVLLKLKPHPDQQSITFTTSYFNPLLSGGGGGGPIPFDLSWSISNKVAQFVKGGWIQKLKPSTYRFPESEKALSDAIEAAGPTLGPVLLSMSEYLMSSFNESYQSRYGGIVMDNQNDDGSLGYTVLHNSSCQHAAPTYINLMNSAILRLATLNENMTIRARNHPLPQTKSQHLQRHAELEKLGKVKKPQKTIYARLLAKAAHALAEGQNKPEPRDLWQEPFILASSWRPCADQRNWEPSEGNNGYILVSANGGINQQRVAVCNAVAVARLLNATLVVPHLLYSSVWRDLSQFGDIYQEEHFINYLKPDIRIVKELPLELRSLDLEAIGSVVTDADIMKEAKPSFYVKYILPILHRHRVVHFVGFGNRLSSDPLPFQLQRLRCRCNFYALQFVPKIQETGALMLRRMRQNGTHFGPLDHYLVGPFAESKVKGKSDRSMKGSRYLALHLRFEIDMAAHSLCEFGGGEEERRELEAYREIHFPALTALKKTTKLPSPVALRAEGLCPLMPEETVLMLAALGFNRKTRIFLAGAHIYGGKSRLAVLTSLYPNLVTKENLLSSSEIEPFTNFSSQLAALDFIACTAADVFAMTDSGSQLSSLVSGFRVYYGGGKMPSIRPNKRRLADIFVKNNTIEWKVFEKRVRKAVRQTKRVRARPVGRSVYRYPRCKECMCITEEEE